MTIAHAPGKLFVAGEYAVVTPGEPAVLVALDRVIECRIRVRSTPGHVSAADILSAPESYERNARGTFTLPGDRLAYVTEAVRVLEDVCQHRGREIQEYDLEIKSELVDHTGRKYGFGSSGAVVVSVLDALARVYGLKLTNEQLFKLAFIASQRVTPHGSGGDLAASVYGGWIEYRSPNRNFLNEGLRKTDLTQVFEEDWPGLSIRPLPMPTSVQLVVGWTGSPAHTSTLVSSATGQSETGQNEFLDGSRAAVSELVDGILRDDATGIGRGIRLAREALSTFERTAGTMIETGELRQLRQIAERHGATAKSSGAGGGDCGIAICDSHVNIAKLIEQWSRHGIRHLPVGIHPARGMRIDSRE